LPWPATVFRSDCCYHQADNLRRTTLAAAPLLAAGALLGRLATWGRLAPEIQAQGKPPAADKPKLAPDIPAEIPRPDKLETRLGTLEFKDGAPSVATVAKVSDNLDFTHVLPFRKVGREQG
jgi:hypothetical protein